jgi:hypothetical protein
MEREAGNAIPPVLCKCAEALENKEDGAFCESAICAKCAQIREKKIDRWMDVLVEMLFAVMPRALCLSLSVRMTIKRDELRAKSFVRQSKRGR